MSKEYITGEWKAFLRFISNKSQKRFPLTSDIFLAHNGKLLDIELSEAPPKDEHRFPVGKKIRTPVGIISAKKTAHWKKPSDTDTAYFKYSDIAKRQLLIRYWKKGDKMK